MFETEKQGMRASLYQLTKTPPLGFEQLIGGGGHRIVLCAQQGRVARGAEGGA
jgi:hypothetical protein